MAAKTDEVVKFVPNSKDLKGLFGAFRAMDDEGKAQVKEVGREYSDLAARRIAAASPLSVYPKQSAIVAASIRKTAERLPLVAIGGPKGQASGGARAGNLVFGNEFGASRYPNTNKFPSRSPKQGRGSKGWWIFPTLKEIQPDLLKQWKDDVKKITDKWA